MYETLLILTAFIYLFACRSDSRNATAGNTKLKVATHANGTLTGFDDNSPFDLSGWKPEDGSYRITAKVFDDGQTKISDPVKIEVGK